MKYDLYKIKNYINEYNNLIILKENKLNIKYSKNKVLINGSSEFYINKILKFNRILKLKKNKNKQILKLF